MTHPLIQRLTEEFGYPVITPENHDAFVGQAGITVLFFAGDPRTVRDSTDVAVILPELVEAFHGRLRPGVVRADSEREIQKHYGPVARPALVFLRDGGYLGVITRVQDWGEYLASISELIEAEVRHPPSFKIPVVTA